LSAKGFDNCCYISDNAVTGSYGSRRNSDVIKNSVPPEGFFIKTAGQSSIAARVKERSITDAFFISFFAYSKKIKYSTHVKSRGFLHFKPQQQKIIFPYHHFW